MVVRSYYHTNFRVVTKPSSTVPKLTFSCADVLMPQSSKCPNSFQDFQFGGPSGSGGNSGGGGSSSSGGKVPPLIREFLSSLDDKEWQSELYKLLQNQSFNQVEVDLFELLCKVLDHNLFAQVDWARNSYYFKELKVGTEQQPVQCQSVAFGRSIADSSHYCQELPSYYKRGLPQER